MQKYFMIFTYFRCTKFCEHKLSQVKRKSKITTGIFKWSTFR